MSWTQAKGAFLQGESESGIPSLGVFSERDHALPPAELGEAIESAARLVVDGPQQSPGIVARMGEAGR